MSWALHLDKDKKALLPALRRQLGVLKHQGRKIPLSCRRLIANAFIMSKLAYLIPLWGSATRNHIRKVQSLWNKVARWTSGLPRKTKIKDLMAANGWMTVRNMITYHSLMMVWKLVNLKKPRHLYNSMRIEGDNHIQTQEPRLQFTARGLKHRASTEWNSLPSTLRNEDSISIFKRTLKKWITEGRDQTPD